MQTHHRNLQRHRRSVRRQQLHVARWRVRGPMDSSTYAGELFTASEE
ncbi:MAG TPA: hypothetical protein VE685_08560 [Thermoanaerobaculia bacterium]|nr:hypothetical protein [Thermoanaerobaculia bacterium]